MRGSGQRCNVGGEGPHTGVALLVRSLRQEELVRNVPDDVITMSHRNVHPHVSIHEVALLTDPQERALMGSADPPSKGVGAHPTSDSRV